MKDHSNEKLNNSKRLLSLLMAVLLVLTSFVPAAFNVRAGETSGVASMTDAQMYKSLELHSSDEESDAVIRLDGIMPADAKAYAVDVTDGKADKEENTLTEVGNIETASNGDADFYDNTDYSDVVLTGEEEGVSTVIAYDITILDGNDKFQPEEDSPIHVEIEDLRISESDSLQLWHIRDDGSREEVEDFTVTDGKIAFDAKGFSIYEIVEPESVPAEEFDIEDPKGVHMSVKGHYFKNSITTKNHIADTALGDILDAGVWHFSKVEDGKYKIYTVIGNEIKYLQMNSAEGLALVTDENAENIIFDVERTAKGQYVISRTFSGTAQYLNLYNNGSNGFAGWKNKSDVNAQIDIRSTELTLGWMPISSLDDIRTYAEKGIYIGSARGNNYSAKGCFATASWTYQNRKTYGTVYGIEKTQNQYTILPGTLKNEFGGLTDNYPAAPFYFEVIGDVTVQHGTDANDMRPALAIKIYTYDKDGNKQYVIAEGGNSTNQNQYLKLTPDAANATEFAIYQDQNHAQGFFIKVNDDTKNYYWNEYGGAGNGQGIFALYSKEDSALFQLWGYIPNTEENYYLDGETYGIFHYSEGDTEGTAFMAEEPSHSLIKMIIHKNEEAKTLYVDQDNEVDEWTFEFQGDDEYKIHTGSGYLKVDENGISFTDENKASLFVLSVDGKKRVQLRSGKYYLSYKAPEAGDEIGSFISTTSVGENSWLNLIKRTIMDDEEKFTYSADRISVSDLEDGKQYIIYTRLWNDEEKHYDMYAIDHDGTLFPVYASGGKIIWLGDATDSLFWSFTEYRDAVTNEPNNYYEFYNAYSEQYLAPQITDNQILSPETIGVMLPGRKSGEYYSDILAWDDARYEYASLKNSDDYSNIESCHQSMATPFYFATLEPLNILDNLHEVATIDNHDYGITMKMVDYGYFIDKEHAGGYGGANYADVTYGVFDGKYGDNKGLLSTNLGADGYPTVNSNGISLKKAYHNENREATEVNHLFLQSVYNSGGYFEYDSAQNFATLVNQEKFRQDGTFEIGNNFTVYREIGTHEKSKGAKAVALQHGQFFPYDTIKAGVFSTGNPENLTNWYEEPLDETDPRKHETLYLIQTDKTTKKRTDKDGAESEDVSTTKNVDGEEQETIIESEYQQKDANYYFGMEMEASFVQTPSGLDRFGHDMIFEFKGDDDFWLYVDGELVLDIGGIHKAQTGSVNFRTGEVKIGNTTKTLPEVFESNYRSRNPSATNEEVKEYLDQFFGYNEVTGEQEAIFKDYSTHDMKVFYMERGGNASNLYMHFNLSSITPGTVTLQKELNYDDGTKADINTEMIQYPFQIWYAEPVDDETWNNWPDENTKQEIELKDGTKRKAVWRQLKNDSENVMVRYQNSSAKVAFDQSYTPPGTSGFSYENIYYISPGKNIEIDFPTNIIKYRLVECAVDTDVYTVKINGEEAKEEAGSVHGKLRSYESDISDSETTPVVAFENIINKNAMRTLEITKRVVDKNNNEIINDNEIFKLRLYLSSTGAGDNQLEPASIVPYRLVDPNGYYCRWDVKTQKFVSTTWVYDRLNEPSTDLSELSDEERNSITFHTSMYGAIDKIPARYRICVPDLPVGTVFKVEERESEMPSGYGLIENTANQQYAEVTYHEDQSTRKAYSGYVHIQGKAEDEEGIERPVVSYEEVLSHGEDHVCNVGQIILGQNAMVDVVNKKGYSLRVNKKWSDLELTTSHGDIYTAVYVNGELLPDTVCRIKSPDISTYYFWPELKEGETTLDNYKVYEVIPEGNFEVDPKTGVVTGYSDLQKLDIGDKNENLEATL
ncbi:MAG: fibro-slime domain-containing protein, partial [Eubacterium sp.]|nr:fibro-slime domain-containing protein [Eubacterium sp.]